MRLTEEKSKLMEIAKSASQGGEMDNEQVGILSGRIKELKARLEEYDATHKAVESSITQTESVWQTIDALKNHPIGYDEVVIRNILDCVRVVSGEELEITVKGGSMVKRVRMC
jgi:hypothetical protein